MNVIKTLNQLLLPKDKKLLGLLLCLSIIVSVIETVSIMAIMVFISIATNFDQILSNKYYSWFYRFLGCTSPGQFVMIIGVLLALFYFLRGLLNIVHIYSMSRFSFTRYHRFATLIFARFLRFSYQDFVVKNSATIGQAIFTFTGMVTQMIFALLSLTSEIFTVLCVYGMLFWINWKMTFVLTFFLSVKSFLIIKLFSHRVRQAGKDTQRYAIEGSKVFNESMGNFKLIKLGLHEGLVVTRLSAATSGYASAQTIFTTLQSTPRFVLETIGFLLLVSIILYVIYRYNNASFVIPIVSLYALAFYRLLPSMNKIFASYNQILFAQHALQGVSEFLQLPTEMLGSKSVTFSSTVQLHNLSFSYLPEKPVLTDVSFVVSKGERIAFMGPSGSGKSTLADIIMGLYTPSSGSLAIDGQVLDDENRAAWRKKIGYIPQSIYLFDGTVADNIVFGRDYDENKIIDACKKAQIYDFLQTQNSIWTCVGEGGIMLSGGQKQRIAIARALYTSPELLVLDEATSALDHETEASIMHEIYTIDRTVTLIIVAHRLSTIAGCDKIYKIEQGHVMLVNFADIMPAPVLQHDRVLV